MGERLVLWLRFVCANSPRMFDADAIFVVCITVNNKFDVELGAGKCSISIKPMIYEKDRSSAKYD